jgi:hypothetical protein
MKDTNQVTQIAFLIAVRLIMESNQTSNAIALSTKYLINSKEFFGQIIAFFDDLVNMVNLTESKSNPIILTDRLL